MKEQFVKLMALAENFGKVSSASMYKSDSGYHCCSVIIKAEDGTEFALRLDIKEAKEND